MSLFLFRNIILIAKLFVNTFLLLLLTAVLICPVTAVAEGRNPFLAQRGVTNAGTSPTSTASLSKPSAAPLLPTIPLPPSLPLRIPPQFIAVPPLPSDAMDGTRSSAPVKVKQDTPKPNSFLNSDEIAASREKCDVALLGNVEYKVPSSGGVIDVPIKLEGGSKCLKAVQATEDWLVAEVVLGSSSTIRVTVDSNEELDPRSAKVILANTKTSLTIRFVQKASIAEFVNVPL